MRAVGIIIRAIFYDAIVKEARRINGLFRKIDTLPPIISCYISFTIIIVYAAQLDSEDCKEDIDSIMALLNSDASFSEEHLLSRDSINKFQNSMEKVNPLNAVESATKVLTPELRQKAFMIAAQIGRAIQEMRYAKILECFNNKTLDRKRIC